MKDILLSPIKESPEDYEKIEREILDLLKKEIFLPVLAELGEKRTALTNSADDLIRAIASGRITFSRGQFKGRFGAGVSRELRRIGATWDRKQGSWKIPLGSLPYEIKVAIQMSEARFLSIAAKVDRQLAQLLPEEIAGKLKIEKIFDTTIFKVDRSFKKSVQGIKVAPDLTPERRKIIAQEYTENLQRYIKDWSEKAIRDLREDIQKNAFIGNRSENMIKVIQKNYEVSQNKAKFLARQETSLLMTKFKEIRYKDAGINEYKWFCVAGSPKHPVRPMHKALENKIFSWNNPPITSIDGKRNNPGEDFNCRCFARPIVKV